jgi:hypothetical protein
MRLALLLAAAIGGLAAPALPRVAGAEVRWRLDCSPGRIGVVTTKGLEGNGTYAYAILTVTNKNGRDLPVSLGVWAETDVAGRTYRGTIDPIVKAEVERKTGRTFKTLTDARAEKLADGASIELLVTFGKIDPSVDVLDIHVLGLVDRVYRDRGKSYVEDKALVLHVTRYGDEFNRQNDLLRLKSTTWKAMEPAKELKSA